MIKTEIRSTWFRSFITGVWFILFFILTGTQLIGQEKGLNFDELMSYPFPNELCTASNSNRIAWAVNANGSRNIYVAEGPDYTVRKLTSYDEDDGQEISSLSLSNDGHYLVYIRGGDFGSNWDDAKPVNPSFKAETPSVKIWSVPFEGGSPVAIGEGENPMISPNSDQVVFIKSGQLWSSPLNESGKAKKLFSARGVNNSPNWSPDGSKIAFRSNRGDHSFIGIFHVELQEIQWVSPSFYRDSTPRWSPNGESLIFIRQQGSGGIPTPILKPRHIPWKIVRYDLDSKNTSTLWTAPKTLKGSMPTTHGRSNLHWANGNVVYLSYEDGWPHLYSVNEDGGEPTLLTPGNYMAEYISLSPDKKWLVFAANTGSDTKDIERRHIIKVSVDGTSFEVMTQGSGLEWTPFIIGHGEHMVYISATAKRPPLVAIMALHNREVSLLGEHLISPNFDESKLVTPKQIVFKSADNTPVHATLFDQGQLTRKKPAIIYIHGGPPRQMLLGWHYSSYYSNAYALNQYLASQGYVVLAVNYRLGIGYGYDFHRPADGGSRGASEYQDIKAAGEWLASQDFVDANRIGVYGGSYGGYLTAMALGRDSDLFAAGVDIHGVHDRTINRMNNVLYPNQFERAPDAEYAVKVAWDSSPISNVDTWSSPVLIIHGDDDRNVAFSQSTDLVLRLEEKGVDLETLVIVDDTHHFMKHANQMIVNRAVIDFFKRKL